MAQAMLSLDRLPDDILYLILEDLDTARDNASVSRTCRRLQRFMQTDGWRAFSLRCFQGLPSMESRGRAPSLRWDRLADSLTWQARAWDRRSLAFQALLPREVGSNHRRRQESFRPPLAVHFQADLLEGGKTAPGSVDGEEMVVWGAGEDVVARYRRRGVEEEEEDPENDDDDPQAVARWRVLDGKSAGFRPGYDDVRGLAIVSDAMGRPRQRGILAGRDNGHLALLSAEDGSFGQTLAQFLPDPTQGVVQDRIYSLDVASAGRALGGLHNRSGLVAATTSSHIAFYALPDEAENEGKAVRVAPAAVFDMAAHGLNHNGRRMPYNVKWMAADGLAAVGLGFRTDQLCFLTARPTGFTLTAAAKSRAFMQRFDLDDETLLLPSSLQPIPPTAVSGGGGSLVLGAWRDGTCRLQDVRTPSSFDLAYQDNIAPSQCFQSLLVYAPDRFLAGNQESTTLKVFDLRWPRRYHHTAGLPCGGGRPFPEPWLAKDPGSVQPPRQRCDPLTGDLCTWHAHSRLLGSRPNCSIYLQRSAVSRYPDIGVWSLARAAGPDGGDLIAPNFYAGLNSCIVEGILCESRDVDNRSRSRSRSSRRSRQQPGDPYYAYPDVLRQRPLSLVPAPPPEQGPASATEWRRRQAALQRRHHYYRTVDLQWYLHEIGDGLADPDNDKRPRRLATPLRGSRPGTSRRQLSSYRGDDSKNDRSQELELELELELSPESRESVDSALDPHRIRRGRMPTEEADVDPVLRRQHRLDSIMQRMADFSSFYEKP